MTVPSSVPKARSKYGPKYGIEVNAIGQIPAEERHGRVRDQFTLWFGLNAGIFPLIIGGVSVSLGLSLVWTCLATVVGYGLGLLLVGFHAIQGPRLGVPQMIQSRGQFGFHGAVLVFAASIVLDFGYLAAQLVIQAEAMKVAIPSIGIPVWIAIFAPPVVVLTIWGHDLLHRLQRWVTGILTVTLIVLTVQTVELDASTSGPVGAPTPAHFLAAVGLFVISAVSWAPYVSDYSRYLPSHTSAPRLFTAVALGIATPSIAFVALGAWLAVLLPHAPSTVAAIGTVSGSWMLVVLALVLITPNTANAYTGMLAFAGIVSCFRRVERSVPVRVAGAILLTATATVCALLGYHNFIANLTNLLNVLLYLFIPWSAINLTDYYLIKHGRYDVASFFSPDGPYGRVMWPGLVAYICAVAIQVPFIDQTYLTGPLVGALGGLDISWIIGGVCGAAFYLLAVKLSGHSLHPDG